VCLDEANRQLIGEKRLPAKPGCVELVDFEYRRLGVANLFVAFEPLGAKRVVEITGNRRRVDFAAFAKDLVDIHYPHTEKIVCVMDNLNIHSIASLYEAFPPREARRFAEKLEIHYTPKHASWQNMAEIEIGILSRQCLAENMTSMDEMRRKVSAWQLRRNEACSALKWQFNTSDAKIKLNKLYPILSLS